MVRISLEVPVPDDIDYNLTPEHEPFDKLVEETIAFLQRYPIFSVEYLHAYLRGPFPISESAEEFREFFDPLMTAAKEVLAVRGTSMRLAYDERSDLYITDLNDPNAPDVWTESRDETLVHGVRQELESLFVDRRTLTRTVIHKYLTYVQRLPNKSTERQPITSSQALALLVEHGFLGKLPNPENHQLDVYFLPERGQTIERPFTDLEAKIAEVLIDKLTDSTGLSCGWYVSDVIKTITLFKIGSLEQYHAVIRRLWRRGYIAIEQSDDQPQPLLFIAQSVYRDAERWPERREACLQRLRRPVTLFISDEPPQRYKKTVT